MRNRLDQLFKTKLSNHTVTPSVNAWDRVKGDLAKKNNKPILFRIAAAVLLAGAMTTTLFWLSTQDHGTILPSTSSLNKKTQSITPTPHPTDSSPQSLRAGIQKTAQQPVSKKNRLMRKDIEKAQIVTEDQIKASLAVLAEEPLQTPGPVTAVASQQKVDKPIVLVYHLETIEQQHAESVSMPGHREKSGLSKVIDFALDAKNGDAGFGDLRQAKDELFAFNFRKDKQNNNK